MLLSDKFFEWIDAHKMDNPTTLRLKYSKATDSEIDYQFAILQIECRRKYAKKFAQTLDSCPRFIFPSALSGEQATGDLLAEWHASLVNSGDRVVDLTAGLGIDDMHISRKAAKVVSIERFEDYAEALRYNAGQMGFSNIEVVCADSREYIKTLGDASSDTIFIDPARRGQDGSRVYDISDCEPDIIQLLPDMRRVAHRVVIKLSPMLDISRTISQLPGLTDIYAAGTATECKEVVAVVDFNKNVKAPEIHAATFVDGHLDDFSFTVIEESDASAEYSEIKAGDYLYEPYPSVMKAGPFSLLSSRYDVCAISGNSHIYFSRESVPSFPGRVFTVEQVLPYSSSVIKRLYRTYPALSITTRNFPVAASQLKAKLKVKDAEFPRLFATTDKNGRPIMIIARP